ncbi:hypothetical protein MED134_02595 [Dokdonia sp. MED134]|uniref:choice-of-anchor D domain-containing protein n=1 Tax=Dokdonia sp. MED134 TaxID=313590 RepID=UPI000068E4D2|nr:choice-of-anchor D domain-containing protein [Dokdonia sp. MED134]EAQ38848.1 hypothetical protein MED134_02595 [Dokdonia sp. MED134]
MKKNTLTSVNTLLFIVLSLVSIMSSFASEETKPASFACTGPVIDAFPYFESWEAAASDWTQNTDDNFDWTRDSNGTPSGNTGPSVASEGFFYMYTESSNPQVFNDTAIMTSPCFDFGNYQNAALTFDYHMYGDLMGRLRLEISDDNGATWTTLFDEIGNKGDVWNNAFIDLSAYDGQNIQLRFNSTRGFNFRSDMAVDNFRITADLLPVPEINITGNSFNILDGDITPNTDDGTDFGDVVVGLNSASFFTIQNLGSQPLSLTDTAPYVAITGPDAAYFSVSVVPDQTIAGFSSTTFAILYTPPAVATHTATITILNNDANESVYNFDIIANGVGAQPEIGISGLGNNINDGDTTPSIYDGTDFGNILLTDTVTRTFLIANTGTADLLLTDGSPYVTITGSPYFTLTTTPSGTIPSSGGSTTFSITYDPLLVGTHTATVTINNNDSNEGSYTFDIEGLAAVALLPEIDITGQGVTIVDGDPTPSINDDTDFNTIELGNSNVNDFTITNSGTGPLTLTGGSPYVTITGADAGQFILETFPTSNTVVAGESTIFQIRYKPLVLGTHNAVVTVTSDDTTEATYNFNIRGNSVNPLIQQYTIYNENFDASDGGWTVTNPGNRTVWTYGQNADEPAGEGNFWYTDNYNNYQRNSDTYAISPVIDCSGYTDLKLQLDVRYDLNNDVDDAMNVEYSTNGGTSWTILGTTGEATENLWYNETDADGLGNNVDGWAGNNSTSTVTSKSRFSRSFINLPSTLYNNPQVRFRVRFASDGDTTVDDGANFDNVIVTGNPLTLPTDPALGPGDVASNLKLWLKSDEGITSTNGTQATTWEDQAADNDAKISNENAPIFFNSTDENINYNPVLKFSEADKTQLKGKGGLYSTDYWVVMQQEGTINGTTTGVYEGILAGRAGDTQFSEDGSGFWTGKISLRFNGTDNMLSHMIGTTPGTVTASTRESYGRAYSSPTDSYTNEVIIINVKANNAGDVTEIYKNGIKVDNVTARSSSSLEDLPYAELTNSPFALGVSRAGLNRNDISTWMNGKITEVISFSTPNSTYDQKRIQSYLAIKNGVTLHNYTSTTISREGDENYIDTDGNIIWNTALHTGFNFDIAGIGRDDASGLTQNQSISSNSDTILSIGIEDLYATNSDNVAANPTGIADKNFLMWGNDNRSLAAASPISVDLSNGIAGLSTLVDFTSVRKTWKVVETGSVGDVKISIPEVSLSATLTPPGNYLMFVSDTPSFSPTSEYRILAINGDNLETTYDFDGTKYITFGYAPEYYYERSITFDGVQNYMDAEDVADLSGPFTISAWVKRGPNSGNREIISKSNTSLTEGYSLGLDGAFIPRILWEDTGGTTRVHNASTALPQDEWHHIAVIYNGTRVTFYIDGVEDTGRNLPSPVASNQHLLIAATDHASPSNFFDGTIDEVRIWNDDLTQQQLQFIMNQEIERFTDASVVGKIIPQNISKNEVATIPWSNLELYLPMNRYTFTNVKDESDNNHVAAIKNLETVDFQTAPLPYVSETNGDWTNSNTWENGSTQQIPGAVSIVDSNETIDWNIVQTSHNVTTNENNTVLGLDVIANELSIENDSKIEVSHYLKLDGLMDLVGESQLIQTENSDLDLASSGRLERDQQGTSDTYSYNVWSSPVGLVNTSTINQGHSISTIMNDGTDPNSPAAMTFATGYNGAPTSPVTISDFWLFTYRNNLANTYSAWEHIGNAGNLVAGDGFTMKGPGTGAVPDPQNYTFIGKPNNGTTAQPINKTINAGNQYLVGNPFPSAIDANTFINDNPHLTGTLLFWEHWGGGSHYLSDYQAGYALYTLSGGTPAVSHPAVSQTGSGTKTPTRFIAVGQGFFVEAVSTGTTTFNNTQRAFAKESTSSTFFFNSDQEEDTDDSNIEDAVVQEEDLREKFRIGFDSPSQFHRQLLMTIDENTTFDYDRAYDGVITSNPTEDMTWMLEDEMAIILGVPAIENDRQFPVRVTLPIDGEISIGLDDLENVNTDNVSVYVLDELLGTTTEITNLQDKYTITLSAGTYEDRFYIVFQRAESEDQEEEETTDEEEQDQTDEETTEDDEVAQDTDVEEEVVIEDTFESDSISVYFNTDSQAIIIDKSQDYEIKSLQLFNILGQLIKDWTPDNEATHIELPVLDVAPGAYILNIEKPQTMETQKLIIH